MYNQLVNTRSGATKGNSGIVHAGFDDAPGTNRAKYCPKGNQMFPQLDRELRFGFQMSGSLVVARGAEDEATLETLLQKGITNGVKGLRIVKQAELREMEPNISKHATAALYAPSAGQVTPYEYTIAVAENAADNGVEFRLRREVTSVEKLPNGFRIGMTHHQNRFHHHSFADYTPFIKSMTHWQAYKPPHAWRVKILYATAIGLAAVAFQMLPVAMFGVAFLLILFVVGLLHRQMQQPPVTQESVSCKYVVNCAGLGADRVARMVGDTSFQIKPRIGEYLLLHKDQGALVNPMIAQSYER